MCMLLTCERTLLHCVFDVNIGIVDDVISAACYGSGHRRCTICVGHGEVDCNVCHSHGKLKMFLRLTMQWEVHTGDHIVEKSLLPKDKITGVRRYDQRTAPFLFWW